MQVTLYHPRKGKQPHSAEKRAVGLCKQVGSLFKTAPSHVHFRTSCLFLNATWYGYFVAGILETVKIGRFF